MATLRRYDLLPLIGIIIGVWLGGFGCCHEQIARTGPASDGPREGCKVILPEYVVEPPDILLIDVLYAIPLPPYHIKSLDSLLVRVPKAIEGEPIAAIYPVDPEGTINLGLSYGAVRVVGMTLPEAKAAIEKQLLGVGLKDPRAEVAVAETRGLQQIRGQHLVRPDGTISLGSYGSVEVTGLTLSAVKLSLEAHLSQFLQNPEVSVDVAAYNSKVFYVVYDGGGAGQQIYRLPITGNETVLDAVSQLNGLSAVADMKKIWLARSCCGKQQEQILPIDWCGITAHGRSDTNYQLMPGDRIFVQSDRFVRADTRVARILAPFEKILGFTLLEASTVQTLKFNNGTGGVP